MTKKKPHESLMGKKRINIAKKTPEMEKAKPYTTNPSHIRNKLKRSEMYSKYLQDKKARKREARLKRQKEIQELGEENVTKNTPKTLENTRELEETWVLPNDEEVIADENEDEFAPYFSNKAKAKIMITTNLQKTPKRQPPNEIMNFIKHLMDWIPNSFYYPRKTYSVKEICSFAGHKKFTHLLVLAEKQKQCNGLVISHLGTGEEGSLSGPTAFFKISNFIPSLHIPGHGRSTGHAPELVLNGFGTRLGHRTGRLLGSLFPHQAQFSGRQVVTFHNQRDYIFARYHRYIFQESAKIMNEDTGKKKTIARLQELGPRFTMKMRWLQDGTFDSRFAEYEWIHKRKEMDTTRRKFHL